MTSFTESVAVLVRTLEDMMWPTEVVEPSRPSATARTGDVAVGEDADEALGAFRFDDRDDANVLRLHETCGVDERGVGCDARRVFST
jgi:hypothetical protein